MGKIIELLNGDEFDLDVLQAVRNNLIAVLESGNELILDIIKTIAKGDKNVVIYHIKVTPRTFILDKKDIALLNSYGWFPTNGGQVFPIAGALIHTLVVVKDDSMYVVELKDIVKNVANLE